MFSEGGDGGGEVVVGGDGLGGGGYGGGGLGVVVLGGGGLGGGGDGLSRSEEGGERRARRRLQPWAAEKATQRSLPIGGVAPTLP